MLDFNYAHILYQCGIPQFHALLKHIGVLFCKHTQRHKNSAALFKIARLKEVMKSKGQPRNGCDDIHVG